MARTVETLLFEIGVDIETDGIEEASRAIDNYAKKQLQLLRAGELTEEQTKELTTEFIQLSDVLDDLQGEVTQTDKLYGKLTNRQNTLIRATNETRVAQAGLGKATNNANQILFSFGDAIQDGAQFQFGFAQGARAIGNNLAFAAEQFALTNQKAGSFLGTVKLLGKSFLGPAGIILAINAAITAVTVLSSRFDRAKKEAEEFEDGIDDLTSTLNEFSKVLGVEAETLLPLLSDEIQNNILALSELEDELDSNLAKREVYGRLIATGTRLTEEQRLEDQRLKEVIEGQRQEIDQIINSTGLLNTVDEEQLRLIQERISEFQQEKLLREAIRELIIANIDDQKILLDIEKARASVANELPENRLIEDGTAIEFAPLDLGAQAGTLAFDLEVLKELNDDFQNALTDEERGQVAERIRLKQEEVNAKRRFLQEEKDFTFSIVSDIARIGINAASIAFGENKDVAIAAALIDTYLAAQKAFTSQIIVTDPTSLGRAVLAAGAATTAGLARVAQISRTEIGSSASGSGGSQASSFVGASSSSNITSIAAQPTPPQITAPPSVSVDIVATNGELAAIVESGQRRNRTNTTRI